MGLAGSTFFFDWEVALILWLQSHMGSIGTAVASFLSMFGEQFVSVAVLGFLYWCYDKKFGLYVGLNVMVANVWNPMIKNIFIRRRPYFDTPGIKCLKVVEPDSDIYDIAAQGYSFPSGHSTNSVTVFTSLSAYKRKNVILGVLGVVIPLLVGISRFCLGVHYPTDVLCGWFLGLFVIAVIPWLEKKIKNRWLFFGILLLTALPGFFYCRSNDFYTSVGMLIGVVAAIPFEEKYVNFENTRSVVRSILRIAGGVAVYFGLNELLKLPFSSSFLDSGSTAALLVRTARYAVVIFTALGIYPMIFKCTAKIGKSGR